LLSARLKEVGPRQNGPHVLISSRQFNFSLKTSQCFVTSPFLCRDCNPSFPSSLSAARGWPGLDNSPSSFFIPVHGGASSCAPSSSSSPAASSFDFSSLHRLDAQDGLFAGPSSCPSQSHSAASASDSSCDNSSSADRPTRRRRLTVVPPHQDSDWGEHDDLEILGHGPLSSGSVFDGSQYPGFEVRDLRSVPIERYSWLNEELAVR
jgi:hypothetical protein